MPVGQHLSTLCSTKKGLWVIRLIEFLLLLREQEKKYWTFVNFNLSTYVYKLCTCVPMNMTRMYSFLKIHQMLPALKSFI
jgi:hypothetical protein